MSYFSSSVFRLVGRTTWEPQSDGLSLNPDVDSLSHVHSPRWIIADFKARTGPQASQCLPWLHTMVKNQGFAIIEAFV